MDPRQIAAFSLWQRPQGLVSLSTTKLLSAPHQLHDHPSWGQQVPRDPGVQRVSRQVSPQSSGLAEGERFHPPPYWKVVSVFFSNVNTSSAQQFQRKGLAVNTLLRSLRTETRPWSLVNFKWFYTYKRLRQCHNDLWFYNSSNKVTRTRGLFLTVLHQSKCNSMPS